MDRSKFTVALLVANLLLVLAVTALWHQVRARSASGPAPTDVTNPPGAGSSARPPIVRVVKTNVVETNAFHWSQVEADDYRTYIERLRAIGVPEQTIRDLVVADIDKLFAPHLAALNTGGGRELKYWEADPKDLESPAEYREREHRRRELDFQKRAILRQLLGIDLVSERQKSQGLEDFFGRRLGFLPEDKRSQVRMILEQSHADEVALRQKTWEEGEPLSDEDQTRLKQIARERESAITNLLSPEELEQYRLALSPLAYKVRDALFGMNPTEEEYLAVFRLNQAFEEKWPPDAPEPDDPEKRQEREQDRALLQIRLREALGEARFAEYQRAQDPDYRQLLLTATRYQLPPAVAAQVYEYKRVVLEQRAHLAGNRSLTPEQQRAALEAMTAETERILRETLGERAFNHYVRNGGGEWVRASAAE